MGKKNARRSSEPRVALALKLDFAKWSARSAGFLFPRQVTRSFLLSSFNAFPQYFHFSRRFTDRASAAATHSHPSQAHAAEPVHPPSISNSRLSPSMCRTADPYARLRLSKPHFPTVVFGTCRGALPLQDRFDERGRVSIGRIARFLELFTG